MVSSLSHDQQWSNLMPPIRRDPLLVRIGAVIAPSLMWATTVPSSDGPEAAEWADVFEVEERLREKYNTSEVRIVVRGQLKEKDLARNASVRIPGGAE